jgi:hypothetical protein
MRGVAFSLKVLDQFLRVEWKQWIGFPNVEISLHVIESRVGVIGARAPGSAPIADRILTPLKIPRIFR